MAASHDQEARAEDHGRLIKERRLDLGLNRPSFVAEMARHGQDITPDYLNKLESGRAPLSRASLPVREALRAVLGYSIEDWQEATGLYVAPASTSGPPIGPLVAPLDLPLVIPDELQQVIDQHAADYPELRNERTLRALTAIRREVGNGYGPQTAADWFEVFIANRRWFPK